MMRGNEGGEVRGEIGGNKGWFFCWKLSKLNFSSFIKLNALILFFQQKKKKYGYFLRSNYIVSLNY